MEKFQNKHIFLSALFIVIIIFITIIIRNMLIERAAGGVIYKIEKGQLYYLLVTTTNGDRWIFPKGKAEFYEFTKQAAVREVKEEAGVKVKVVFILEGAPFFYEKTSGKKQNIELFAMEYIKDANNWHEKHKRKRKWMAYSEAVSVLTPEFRKALEEVNNILIEK